MEPTELGERVSKLMRRVWDESSQDFSGLGVVFYRELVDLPHASLQVPSSDSHLAGSIGDEALAELLNMVSNFRSPWHDGFHFISVNEMRLTHIAQFVSPPVPSNIEAIPLESGARHMTAALASMVKGIALVAVLPAHGEIVIYDQGKRAPVKEIS